MYEKLWTLVLMLLAASNIQAEDRVDFSQQIRPLLSDRCFACHGPDENHRQGGFRIDQKQSLSGSGDSGESLLVPGHPEQSEIFLRITTTDETLRMPPAPMHPAMTAEEVDLIRQWILQGASWEEHWAYRTPQRPELPPTSHEDSDTTPVDRFLLARLIQVGLKPAERADKHTLLRRVTLDLTGVPPTPEEYIAFLNDDSPDAYEKVVDRLLNSPRYGEHMAHYWLDAVRYGDTHGLHLDNYREMWPYRDWVIDAFNQNLPYDQFLRDQLAGDLLENPTPDQLIASGYNRCNVTTSEGGSIAEEVYVRNVVERVVNFGTVFLGATFDCTRCHDHKFDPYTQKDFYSLFAYFNSLDGNPLDGNKKDHAPVLAVPSAAQKQQQLELEARQTHLNQQKAEFLTRIATQQQQWEEKIQAQGPAETPWQVLIPQQYSSQGKATLTLMKDHSLLATGENPAQEIYEIIATLPAGEDWKTIRLEGLTDPSLPHQGTGRSHNSNVVLTEFQAFLSPDGQSDHWQPISFDLVRADHEQPDGNFQIENTIDGKPETGWAVDGHRKRENRIAYFTNTAGFGNSSSSLLKIVLKHESIYSQHQFGRFRLSATEQTLVTDQIDAEILKIVQTATQSRNNEQKQQLQEYYASQVLKSPEFLDWNSQLEKLSTQLADLQKQVPTTLIFKETAQPKPAFVLNRGEYDQPGEQVHRKIPAVFSGWSAQWPDNRLGLAEWLTATDNPLTTRVYVNRRWQQLFGTGLVKTSEDFGSQGEPPSHPQLLDWLAVDFRENGWDTKRLMKQLVMTSAYQQSSAINAESKLKDPYNRLLSRGPRFRLDAEMLRDQALFVSGLLVEKQGGPSVKPPQPAGLWEAVGYTGSNTARFTADSGPDKILRRTIYTFIKRTAPPPQLGTFDGPSRESSCVRRERTNTPMQQLLLFNDPQFLECAQGLAIRGLNSGNDQPEQILDALFLICLGRSPLEEESKILLAGWKKDLAGFQAEPERAAQLNQSCSQLSGRSLQEYPAEALAAWTITANILLTRDVFLNKN